MPLQRVFSAVLESTTLGLPCYRTLYPTEERLLCNAYPPISAECVVTVMESSRIGASALHLIAVLGDTLARVQAAHAKEDFGVSQIVASIKFVNQTIDAWIESSEQQPESSQFHIYESDLSAVSKSIDAILGEARVVRGMSSKRTSATSKGPVNTPDDAVMETPRKSKAADHKKKTLERFSQALHMKPTKSTVNPSEEHSSFPAAQEMLLRWMETKKGLGWINAHSNQQKHHNSTGNSGKCSPQRSNAAKKFLDSLWSIHSTPPKSATKAEQEGDAGGHPDEPAMDRENIGDSSTDEKQVEAMIIVQSMQKNVEALQAQCKLIDREQLHSELLHVDGGAGYTIPRMSTELQPCHDEQLHVGNEEESSAINDESWLPAKVCWRVLGMQVKGIVMDHEAQDVPTLYSHLQQAVVMMHLVQSIHRNLFHCHLQSLLAHCFLSKLPSTQHPAMRIESNILSSSSVYLCFRLAHCLVCNNGNALLSVASRIHIT